MAESTTVSNYEILQKYMKLPQKGKVMAEYVWIDGTNGLRTKSKVGGPHSASSTLRVLESSFHPNSHAHLGPICFKHPLNKSCTACANARINVIAAPASMPGQQAGLPSEIARAFILKQWRHTLNKPVSSPDELPEWNFDGSSTAQAPGDNSDVYIRPVAIYPDPWRGEPNIVVLCETWDPDGSPNKFNYRHEAARLMEANKEHELWFGLEQEYTLLGLDDRPYGWPKNGFPGAQGPYYCGVGTGRVFCRDIVEAHYKACMYAGINIAGTNAEVMPAQWEYQVGPCEGIELGDHLWMSRFFLHRVAEEFGAKVSFHPKPIPGDWNGAGLHTNVSSAEMRKEGGMKHIEAAMKKLAGRHEDHIAVYGEGNKERLTGAHETGSIDKFTWAVADRGASVRIPRQCAREGKGYFEDRRPASNADPYQITGIIVETIYGGLPGETLDKE